MYLDNKALCGLTPLLTCLRLSLVVAKNPTKMLLDQAKEQIVHNINDE